MASGRLPCILLPNSSHGCMVRPTLGDTSGHGTILIPWRMNNWCASNERWAGALSLRHMVQHFRCQCMTDSSAHPNRTAHQRRHPEIRLHYAHPMRLHFRHHVVSNHCAQLSGTGSSRMIRCTRYSHAVADAFNNVFLPTAKRKQPPI